MSKKNITRKRNLLKGKTMKNKLIIEDISNFNKEIGEEIAFENAKEKIWLLEGYLLQEKLYQLKLNGRTK